MFSSSGIILGDICVLKHKKMGIHYIDIYGRIDFYGKNSYICWRMFLVYG